jgi:hypothetical protein
MSKSNRKVPIQESTEQQPENVVELRPRATESSTDMAISGATQTCWETYRLLVSSATRLGRHRARESGREGIRRNDIALLWDAAECAKWTAEFLLRNSPSGLLIASMCAEVCDDVADEIESRYEEQEERSANPNITLILDCAEKIRHLADTCDQLADEVEFGELEAEREEA